MTAKPFLLFFMLLFSVLGNAQESVVGDIKIQGNKKIKTSFIKNLIETEAGMVLDSSVLKKDIVRLKRLPSVSYAYFQVFPVENNGYDVLYTIEENITLIPFANLYTSSNDEFAFRIGLQEFNLFGRNIMFGGFYQYDVFNSYGVNLRMPYLFSNTFGLAIEYKDLTTQEPVFFDNATADYKYNNRGVEVLGLYELNFNNRIELGISLFTEDYKYISGATRTDIPQSLNVNKHLFKFIYGFEDLEYHYQYLNGFRSTLNIQYVGSTDENLPEFLIGFNDLVFYKRIGRKGNWANRLRLGLASNIETPFAPFTVDNNVNIRGVGNTIDRGTGTIVLNTEYRHTLIDKDWFVLQGNVFVDGGTWRNPGGGLGDFSNSQNIRIYPGVGLRFIHKRIFNAIFRIDYGYGITKDASRGIVFGIGQYF